MATLEISLPEPLMAFVEAQVASGAYESTSAMLEALVRGAQEWEERRQAARESVEWSLLEGLDSGEPIPVTQEYEEARRAALRTRFAAEK